VKLFEINNKALQLMLKGFCDLGEARTLDPLIKSRWDTFFDVLLFLYLFVYQAFMCFVFILVYRYFAIFCSFV